MQNSVPCVNSLYPEILRGAHGNGGVTAIFVLCMPSRQEILELLRVCGIYRKILNDAL